MSSDEEVVRRYYAEVWEQGRLELLGETHAAEVRIDLNGRRTIRTRAEIADSVGRWRAANADCRVEIHQIMSVPGRVAVVVTFHGTARAGGTPVTQPAIAIFSLASGSIVSVAEIVQET